MWNRYGMGIAALGIGLTASLVSYDVAYAARSRDYTPKEMRAVLAGLGYDVKPGDNLTDKEVVAAVRQFQQGYKIQVDGLAGPQTQDMAAELMKILQASLNLVLELKPPLPRNQFYTSEVEAAVRQYQQKAGLPVTGIASLPMRQKLDLEAENLVKTKFPRTRTTPTPSPSPTPSPTPQAKPSPSPSPTPSAAPRTTSPSPARRPRIRVSPSPAATPQTSPSPLPTATPQTSPSPLPTAAPQTQPSPSGLPIPETAPSPLPMP
ncbi:MAG: peptidoglycan-binding protein [Potamolinea sp.]